MNNSMLEQKLPISNDIKNMISNIGTGKDFGNFIFKFHLQRTYHT